MKIELILPLSIAMGLVSYTLIAKWYLMPWLASLSRDEALTRLLLIHTFRYLGLAFLIPGVTAEHLDARFADPAAYGDLLAAILALAAIITLRLGWSVSTPLVWIFNLVGMLDLLNALFQGVRFVPNGHFGSTYFIPAVVVPALLVTHVAIFVIPLRRRVAEESE